MKFKRGNFQTFYHILFWREFTPVLAPPIKVYTHSDLIRHSNPTFMLFNFKFSAIRFSLFVACAVAILLITAKLLLGTQNKDWSRRKTEFLNQFRKCIGLAKHFWILSLLSGIWHHFHLIRIYAGLLLSRQYYAGTRSPCNCVIKILPHYIVDH